MPFKKIRNTYTSVVQWTRRVITQPRSELNRWQSAVRFGYEMGVHGARALQRDRASQMAAALAFRTLFALLPVIVVSTVVVKAVGGVGQFQDLVRQIIKALGINDISFTPPGATTPVGFGPWMEELVGQASSINLAAIGWIGLAVVVYSAISLMVTVENSFNTICRAPEGRAWARRVPMYWAVLTLGPALIGITFYIDSRFSNLIESVWSWKWVLTIAKLVWGLSVTTLLMFGVYRLVPNTKVGNKPAMIGALVAALFLQIGKVSLGAYFKEAFSIQTLYASLGMIPLLMFWVYLMWLVILFGMEVASVLHLLHGRRPEDLEEKRPPSDFVDPATIIAVMEHVAARFREGKPCTTRELADALRIPESSLLIMLDRLVLEGLLHRLERDESSISLACPPESVSAERLLDIGYQLVDEGAQGTAEQMHSAIVHRLREAQKAMAAKTTLATLAAPLKGK